MADQTITSKEKQVDMAACKKEPNKPVELSLLDIKSNALRTSEIQVEDKDTTKSPIFSSGRIWMVTAIVFGAVAVALAIYIIYDSSTNLERNFHRDGTTVESEKVILKFPGFFRTVEQQTIIARKVKAVEANPTLTTNVTVSNTTSPSDKCDYKCNCFESTDQPRKRREIQEFYRSKRQAAANIKYHGCCISTSKFISPTTLYNVNYNERTLSQFTNERQYFLVDVCSHAQGCTGCTCQQEMNIVTAVVENPITNNSEKHIVDFVVVPGCCKCFN